MNRDPEMFPRQHAFSATVAFIFALLVAILFAVTVHSPRTLIESREAAGNLAVVIGFFWFLAFGTFSILGWIRSKEARTIAHVYGVTSEVTAHGVAMRLERVPMTSDEAADVLQKCKDFLRDDVKASSIVISPDGYGLVAEVPTLAFDYWPHRVSLAIEDPTGHPSRVTMTVWSPKIWGSYAGYGGGLTLLALWAHVLDNRPLPVRKPIILTWRSLLDAATRQRFQANNGQSQGTGKGSEEV